MQNWTTYSTSRQSWMSLISDRAIKHNNGIWWTPTWRSMYLLIKNLSFLRPPMKKWASHSTSTKAEVLSTNHWFQHVEPQVRISFCLHGPVHGNVCHPLLVRTWVCFPHKVQLDLPCCTIVMIPGCWFTKFNLPNCSFVLLVPPPVIRAKTWRNTIILLFMCPPPPRSKNKKVILCLTRGMCKGILRWLQKEGQLWLNYFIIHYTYLTNTELKLCRPPSLKCSRERPWWPPLM